MNMSLFIYLFIYLFTYLFIYKILLCCYLCNVSTVDVHPRGLLYNNIIKISSGSNPRQSLLVIRMYGQVEVGLKRGNWE